MQEPKCLKFLRNTTGKPALTEPKYLGQCCSHSGCLSCRKLDELRCRSIPPCSSSSSSRSSHSSSGSSTSTSHVQVNSINLSITRSINSCLFNRDRLTQRQLSCCSSLLPSVSLNTSSTIE